MIWQSARRIRVGGFVFAALAAAIAPSIAGNGEPDETFELRVMRDGTEVEIHGPFRSGLLPKFGLLLLHQPKLKTVHLASGGGEVGEAIAVGQLIRAWKLDTYVAGECYSACTLAFAAGRRRWLDTIGHLGFHAPTRRGGGIREWLARSPFGQMPMSYRIAGFAEPFIAKVMATPNTAIWRPSLSELREAGVVTDVSDGSEFAWSGFGPHPAMRAFAEGVANVNVSFRSVRDHDPPGFDRLVRIFEEGYAAAKPRTEVIGAFWTAVGKMLEEKWPLADDATMVSLAALMAGEYEVLGRKDPAACYRFAKGEMSLTEFRDSLPPDVWSQHEAWQVRMIATAKAGAHRSDDAATARKRHVTLVRKLGRKRAALVDAETVAPVRYRDFCDAATAEFRAIARLPASEAGPMMRAVLKGQSGDVAARSTR